MLLALQKHEWYAEKPLPTPGLAVLLPNPLSLGIDKKSSGIILRDPT
jgi:hypothetical protein